MGLSKLSTRTLLSFTVVVVVLEPSFSREAIIPRNIRMPKMPTMILASTKPTIEPSTTRQNLRDRLSC